MDGIEQSAYLLHSRPIRDNKVIAEFITKNNGKISAIAYVGNSAKSRKKPLLQPFIPLSIVLKGKKTLPTLSQIESTGKPFLLTGDHLYSAFYLNELQVRLLGEHIPYDELFLRYHASLTALANKQTIEPILRQFETILLEELGVSIDYSIVFEENYLHYYYIPEQGFTGVSETNRREILFSKEHLLAIAQQDFSQPGVMKSYKLIMRQVFNHLLGGSTLNSRQLFNRHRE